MARCSLGTVLPSAEQCMFILLAWLLQFSSNWVILCTNASSDSDAMLTIVVISCEKTACRVPALRVWIVLKLARWMERTTFLFMHNFLALQEGKRTKPEKLRGDTGNNRTDKNFAVGFNSFVNETCNKQHFEIPVCENITGALSTKFVILHKNSTRCLLLLIFHTWLCKMLYLISSLHLGSYLLCLVHNRRGGRRKAIAKCVCNLCRRVLCSCRGRRVSLISYFIVCWVLWSHAVCSFSKQNFSICLSSCCYFLFLNWLKVFVCNLLINCLCLTPSDASLPVLYVSPDHLFLLLFCAPPVGCCIQHEALSAPFWNPWEPEGLFSILWHVTPTCSHSCGFYPCPNLHVITCLVSPITLLLVCVGFSSLSLFLTPWGSKGWCGPKWLGCITFVLRLLGW